MTLYATSGSKKSRLYFLALGLMWLTLTSASASAQVTFYLSPGNDPTGDLAWQAAVGPFTEFDMENLTAPVDALVSGSVTVDIGLDGLNGPGSTALLFASSEFSTPGTIDGLALLNLESNGFTSQMTFSFAEPVEGFGAWIYDDGQSLRESIRMYVTDALGVVHASGILESGNTSGRAVEGFLGAVSEVGILHVAIENLDESTGAPIVGAFEVDHVQVGEVVPSDTTPPTSVAGTDQGVTAGSTAQLDGTASYDDTTATAMLDYSWSFVNVPAGSQATLLGHDTANPSFAADLPGAYTISLVVTDEVGLVSAPDEVTISSLNLAPAADAGEDQSVLVNTPALLDGIGSSDPDDHPLTYAWTIASAPGGSAAALVGANTETPSLTPDLAGDYTITLVVNDGFVDSEPAEVVVTGVSPGCYAKGKIIAAMGLLRAMPSSAFDRRGHKRVLLVYLRMTLFKLRHGHDCLAAVFLGHLLLPRIDGVALRGAPDPKGWHQPNRPDWIVDPSAQLQVYALISDALSTL